MIAWEWQTATMIDKFQISNFCFSITTELMFSTEGAIQVIYTLVVAKLKKFSLLFLN